MTSLNQKTFSFLKSEKGQMYTPFTVVIFTKSFDKEKQKKIKNYTNMEIMYCIFIF